MVSLHIVTVLVVVFGSLDRCNGECPDGWVTNSDSCYLFDHSNLNFKEAEALCTQETGHLVQVETPEENTFLTSFISYLKPDTYWIGLSDEVLEHSWTWLNSNREANFTNWYSSRPTTSRTRNCAVMIRSYKFTWLDTKCTYVYPAICEKR